MLRNRIKAAPPALHAIRIERRGFRRHSEYDFGLRVNVDELAVDAERDQHPAIAVDTIPLAAIAPFGNISANSERAQASGSPLPLISSIHAPGTTCRPQ